MLSQVFLSEQEQRQVVYAIEQAEKRTSGEMRLHIEPRCKGDVMDRAAYIFEKLEMHKTELRNGVLFYVAYEDKKVAILGDAGINAKVPEHFWDSVYAIFRDEFSKGNYVAGLEKAIAEAGEQLATHFPYQSNDTNELSNEISFDV
jgi:uncharacterized membrane protein